MTNLRQIRKSRGLSQVQLAEKAGVPVWKVQKYETGEKNINKAAAETVVKIAKALDCDAEDLLCGGQTIKLYMAVTPDPYELPLCVCDSVHELARKFGVTKGTIMSSMYRKKSGKNKGRKFVIIEVEEDE